MNGVCMNVECYFFRMILLYHLGYHCSKFIKALSLTCYNAFLLGWGFQRNTQSDFPHCKPQSLIHWGTKFVSSFSHYNPSVEICGFYLNPLLSQIKDTRPKSFQFLTPFLRCRTYVQMKALFFEVTSSYFLMIIACLFI